MEPQDYFNIHKRSAHATILRQINPVHAPISRLEDSFLILSSHLCPVLPSGFFTSGLPTNTQGVKIWFRI
jgi:hypothetical protein